MRPVSGQGRAPACRSCNPRTRPRGDASARRGRGNTHGSDEGTCQSRDRRNWNGGLGNDVRNDAPHGDVPGQGHDEGRGRQFGEGGHAHHLHEPAQRLSPSGISSDSSAAAPNDRRRGADDRERREGREGESVGAGGPGVDEQGCDDDGAESGDGLAVPTEDESEGGDCGDADGAYDGGFRAYEGDDRSQDEEGCSEAQGLSRGHDEGDGGQDDDDVGSGDGGEVREGGFTGLRACLGRPRSPCRGRGSACLWVAVRRLGRRPGGWNEPTRSLPRAAR